MKIKLLFFLLTCMAIVNGQVVVNKTYPVNPPDKEAVYHPVFSPDGKQMLFSSNNYAGLFLYDIDSKSVKEITKDEGAGLSPSFSEDGRLIYYKRVTLENKRKYTSIMSYNLLTGEIKKVTAPAKEQSELNKERLRLAKADSPSENYVTTEKLKMVLYKDGKRMEMEPVGKVAGYIWVSLSPDKGKILFTAVSKGTFVCDLSGKIIASLGKLNAPVWYNNEYVVGMDDKDNGEVITSSVIVMASLDGKLRQKLTPADKIALYPDASSNSKRVAYTTDKGELYIMEIDINN